MGTQGTGRKRSTKKERSTAEDDALNLIAREAEARLAAKRAARAEAREIRMKELERQQKELSDDDERMSVGSRGSVRVEDRDYLEKGSRAASVLTAATLTSLGGSSSRRGSGETAVNVDAETSLREIKDALVEVEEKYRKAMVSNAQLDNEKNNLMYQVDTLKDSLMELEELLAESRRGYEEKVKEYDREKHAHSVLQFQFSEMKETLKQSEELLNEIRLLRIKQEGFVREISDLQETVEWKDKKIGALERQKEYTDAIRIERDELREEVVKLKDILKKHGIVLGPDLNINGEVGESEVDGTPSADPDSQPAQDSKTCPAEGNSMLGNTDENGLRSSGEEKVDPEQHQEMFEEAKDSPLSSDVLCDVLDVSTLGISSEEQQTYLEEDKRTTTKDNNVEESYLSKDEVESNDQSITDAKDIIVSSPGLQGILTSPEENVPEMPEGADSGETETKSTRVDTHTDDNTESCTSIFEEQENKQEEEESNLRKTESCHLQTVALDVVKECFSDESIPVPVVSNPEPQQENNNAGETENDEAEEMSRKAQPQGASASGKKKKRKRRGKKKGGAQEEHSQQKGGADEEKSKTGTDKSTEPEINGSITATLEQSRVDQVKNEQGSQKTDEVDGEEALKPTETFSPNESLQESRMDHGSDECEKEVEEVEAAKAVATEAFSHFETPEEGKEDPGMEELNKELSLESEAVGTVEAVKPAHVDTLTESTADPGKEQDEEQILEMKVADVGSITETNLSTSDLITSKDDHVKESSSPLDNSKGETDISNDDNVTHAESETVDNAEDEVRSIDEMQSESSADNPETTCDKQNSDAEANVPSSGDIAADESESISSSHGKDDASVSDTDGFTEDPKSFLLSAAIDSGSNNGPTEVSDRRPEETTETFKDDEKLGSESEQESCSPSVDGEDSELKAGRTEQEELNGGLREAEGLVQPGDDEKSDSDSAPLTNNADTFDTVKSTMETAAPVEQPHDVESQTLQCEDRIDESNTEESSELEEINIIDSIKEATEIESPIEQDQRTEESSAAEDLEHKNSQNDEHSDMQQLHEPSKDKSDDYDSSQPTLQESDEEDGEDDEGQSFDFDDMDVEAAVATSLLEYPKEEEAEEEESEVMPDESNNNSLSNENREDELVESIDETDTKPRDNNNSLTHEDVTSDNVCEKQKDIPEQEVSVADEPRHITKEGKALNVGELGVVAEDINQTKSLPAEEELHAIKHETPGENLGFPKSAEQVASNKEPQQTGKDVRKNNKKGKGKGKEECKMS